jgi:hypothetical protein
MLIKGWRDQFVSMVQGLKNNPQITVDQVAIAEPATPEEISAAKALVNGALSTDIIAFYEEMNGFNLKWQSSNLFPGNRSVRGIINILPITQVFGNWQGATWFPGDTRYQPIKPFDLFTSEACAAFYLPQGVTESVVYFHYFGEASVNTGYTFTEYLERLLISRGFWYWIQSLSTETTDNPEAESFRQKAPLLFSDFQPNLFVPQGL